ncbi:MAG: hypothetical protein R2697_04600 [Ilumatobacteraceae bacterium]
MSSDTMKMVWPSEAARLSYPDWIVDRLTDELGRARRSRRWSA